MKIDIFAHISPSNYETALLKTASSNPRVIQRHNIYPEAVFDLKTRFRAMDKFADYRQVLTLAEIPVEQAAGPEEAEYLAKTANDELAELVVKYPDRFVAAVAAMPMNNLDAALKETERAIKDLHMKGVQVYSHVNHKPLDSPEFLPLYEAMAEYDLPVWIHPTRWTDYADYKTEERSFYKISSCLGWPHETSVAMARLSCSGILEKYPHLKFITHHCGGTIPYLAARIAELNTRERIPEPARHATLTKEPVDYLKMFFADTATYGEVSALMCGYSFFGADHILFGTDMPFAVSELFASGVRLTINGIDQMPISDAAKKKIYVDNAKRLLHLE